MDFSFLPETIERGKRFARFTIKPPTVRKNGEIGNSGFYYIGKNPANIEKLVKIFKRGYASEAINNAKAELNRCLAQEKNSIPEIIFCESQFESQAIRDFSQFLSNHPILSAIPFVLDATSLSEADLHFYKQNKLVDDIIFLEDSEDDAILAKTKFLRKIKLRAVTLHAERRAFIQLLMPEVNTNVILKRIFDVLVSAIALTLLSPIFLLIAVAISLESKGNVFYIAKRAGRGYKIFDFYKFRSMRVGADASIGDFAHLNQYNTGDASGPVFIKISNDPRVTKVGAFLRQTSLDELPQLLNVLLGDMSLVGNRPLPLYEAATLTTDECAKRFLAPAGITGLWQIKKRGKEEMSVEERINLDIDYANKFSFMYDLWIMANTPSALMQKSSV